MAPGEIPAWCLSRNGGRGGGGRGGGGVVSGRRGGGGGRLAPPAIQETSEDDWIRLNQHLHATFKKMSSEEIRANIAPTIIEETLVRLREVFGQFQICAVVWVTKLHGQTAGDERPAPNVDESRPHSEEESRLGEQQRAHTERRTKRRAETGLRPENEPRAKQRDENEPRAKQRAEDETRAKQRAKDETRAKQRAENGNDNNNNNNTNNKNNDDDDNDNNQNNNFGFLAL